MKELKYLLGQKIKELRLKHGYSQQQLAELINIDQRNMSNIECGNSFPSKTLQVIANAFNISVSELFDFEYFAHNSISMKEYIRNRIDNLNDENIKIIYRIIKNMQ